MLNTMKTSNFLLIALFSLTLLALLGSNLVLKTRFDKIDKKDPLYGYKKEAVQPFKYVRLHGKAFGVTEIHPGKKFEILAAPEKKYYDWKVVGDTLILNYKREWEIYGPFNEQTLSTAPNFYISAPEIKTITSQNTAVKVKDWKNGDMVIKMEKGALLLTENAIENLNTDVQSGGLVKFDSNNNFGNVAIQVKDSSSLKIEKDVFKSFKANVEAAAHIDLPGNLYTPTHP
jgi:hypothetical protein